MTGPDPVDVRLLTAVAETGRAAVHEIAARLGMDIREVAARLAVLSTSGLPLVVGVECDQNGVRNALIAAGAWQQPSGSYPVHGSMPPGPQSGPYGTGPSGGYPMSGPHPAHSGPYPGAAPVPPPPQGAPGPYPPAPPAPQQMAAGGRPDPMHTWGPPGSASWAGGQQQPPAPPAPKTGKVSSKLDVEGADGERLTIQLVEVVDPADFLYTAAGYQLPEGQRAVVVHTELTNRAAMPFTSLPDLYLTLVRTDGTELSKASVSLSSRPPHRMGVPPGETAGGHTVYVLPEDVDLTAVRWRPRPDDEQRMLTWDISDL